MPIKTVGIVSRGDMGWAIAVVQSQQGLRTICADAPNVANATLSQQRFAIAALDERSKGTRQLAAATRTWLLAKAIATLSNKGT